MDSNAYCAFTPKLSPFARVCYDAVSFLPEAFRHDAFPKYWNGYLAWLDAGLPALTGTQLRAAANCAPDIEQGIRLHATGVLDPASIIGMKTDI